ncbi:MAG: hypothetical protein OQK48_07225 [Sulfurimonas sp.]|uniref:hypothetical protein n=1 Tax=Sulfurimonas sp. TaxID=2022749 RepID=UPI00262BD330|nr:hypothetical protein [Sulfurimonas sp.]MCW8895560.1 hypothetical protein [Sulfurimonas sp.]MCW8954722.1 hypothetical protein [Sulfurimonas sp.]
MNEMYDMSIVTHSYSVLAVLGVILVNFLMIKKATNLQKYKRTHTLFNPIGSTFLGALIFTGVIMMAAKHLDFTIENIIMIVFSIVLIILEVKRSLKLKYLNKQNEFTEYKLFAYKLLALETFLTISISIWMWL